MRDELAERYPKVAEKAAKSRVAAIRLFCVECMGGCVGDARTCATKECFLWPHAFKATRQKEV